MSYPGLSIRKHASYLRVSFTPTAMLLIAAALVSASPARSQAPWEKAAAPLMTRWAREVSPADSHPEYPRPQMTRSLWLNLNGLWQFAPGKEGEAAPFGKTLARQILVPFPEESALSGIMERHDRVWYRRVFTVPQSWRSRRILLHFGAVDWESTVYLNGRLMGTHRGGYDGFTIDITPALAGTGQQELVVGVFDPTDAGSQPRGKQVNHPGGIMYTSTTGIWQTVWLEPVPLVSIDRLVLTPDLDHQSLLVTTTTRGNKGHGRWAVRAAASSGDIVAGMVSGLPDRPLRLHLPAPHEWSPSDPFLYGLKITLEKDGHVVDTVRSYFGMRKIAVASDGKVMRLMLNNRPLFQMGVLDQGFWPDGEYTAPTDAALRFDIEMEKKLGFNMARKHVKVEPDRWYYWADKLGLIVWQDMPAGDNRTPESKIEFADELHRMVAGRRNHPCIVMWVVFNEGWGQFDTERLVREVASQDPSRLVDDASGWTDKGVGSVLDKHQYPSPAAPSPSASRAAVDGEFGGLGLGVDGHTWSQQHWGYQGMASSGDLTRRYQALLQQVWRNHRNPGLSAAVYTQITDVETESNGLMTYDRAVVKVDARKVSAANRGLLPPLPEPGVLVPTAQAKPVTWRYTFDRPPGNWFRPGFDDSGWKEGPAGFGTAMTPGAVVRTTWSTPDIWIRRHFTLAKKPSGRLSFLVHHDEDVEIYLNGALAGQAPGYVSEYTELEMTDAGRKALRTGDDTIAIHCHQTTGGQYIDAGIISTPR